MVVLLPSSLRSSASWMRLPIAPPWHSWSKAFQASFWRLLLWSSGAPDFFTSSRMAAKAAWEWFGSLLLNCRSWLSLALLLAAQLGTGSKSMALLSMAALSMVVKSKSKFEMEDGKSNSYTITGGFMFCQYIVKLHCVGSWGWIIPLWKPSQLHIGNL